MTTPTSLTAPALRIDTDRLSPSPFSVSIYGEPGGETADLLDSIRESGVLVPLVVAHDGQAWEVISGNRRLACALALGLPDLPCEVRSFASQTDHHRAVLEYNRQRRKTFTQQMREADAMEQLLATQASGRSRANLRRGAEPPDSADRRDSDGRGGRTDSTIASLIGLGGKDTFRQARKLWTTAQSGDDRARSGVSQIDAGLKTIHAAYKDLRRRDRYSANFRPTPYDVWSFKHDRAFGIPHPGSIPPGIIAHTLHYFTKPGALVVDPMSGGGTTLDVCESMGRRCLAYDIAPQRPIIASTDVRLGFPPESSGCDLIFCDPPYHTMLARQYASDGVAEASLDAWLDFLKKLARDALAVLKPGGYLALLLANQTEKDLPRDCGYLDHAFSGYKAIIDAGFLPERRISCPMDGAYLPQHVRRARLDGRMLGQVRDLIVARKPLRDRA